LNNSSVSRADLKKECDTRTIQYEHNASTAVLKAALYKFNQSRVVVWSSRMLHLAFYVRMHARQDRPHLHGFQAAISPPAATLPSYSASPLVEQDVPPMSSSELSTGIHARSLPKSTPMATTREVASGPISCVVPQAVTGGVRGGEGATPDADFEHDAPSRVGGLRRGGDVRRPSDVVFELASTMRAQEVCGDGSLGELGCKIDKLAGAVTSMKDTVQANTHSTTLAHARMEGAVSVLLRRSRETDSVEASMPPPVPSKNAKYSAATKATDFQSSTKTAPRARGDGGDAGAAPPVAGTCENPPGTQFYLELLHGIGLEPELISGRMRGSNLIAQIAYMVQLCHVSAGVPGIFRSLVVKELSNKSMAISADATNAGRPVADVNKHKETVVKKIVDNKAADYLRVVKWVHSFMPSVLEGAASGATADSLLKQNFVGLETKVIAAINTSAGRVGLHANAALRNIKKAKYSDLRSFICNLSSRHVLVNNIDAILSTSPFKERL